MKTIEVLGAGEDFVRVLNVRNVAVTVPETSGLRPYQTAAVDALRSAPEILASVPNGKTGRLCETCGGNGYTGCVTEYPAGMCEDCTEGVVY